MTEYRELNLSDIHFPYHDPYAVALALKIAQVIQPTKTNLLGDILNCSALGPFPKNPVKKAFEGFKVELALARDFFGLLRGSLPKGTPIDMIPGNHCDWFRKYLWMYASALADLDEIQLEALLHLDEYGIRPIWPDYDADQEPEIQITPTTIAKHGSATGNRGGMAASKELDYEGHATNTITGHTHRLAWVARTLRHGPVYGVENGCLCLTHSREWVTRPNWQKGLSVTLHWGGDESRTEIVPFLGEGDALHAVVLGQEVRL